jgi:3-oxoacyl-[acyl-carrier protein] reductase
MVTEDGKTFEELWRARAAGNPARRFGCPEELGDYCAFLCGANAGFITGQNLLIDGGSYPGDVLSRSAKRRRAHRSGHC